MVMIKTTGGIIQGVKEERDGIVLRIFRGIPYAATKRFQRPQNCTWEGILDASSFGKTSMMTNDDVSFSEMGEGEEALNLNIYAPEQKDLEEKLPVLVDIHGGAFQNGSNRGKDPFRVCKKDRFVYVGINYRLGALGYLYLGDLLGKEYAHTGNNGTLDQEAALRWVQENIEAFGGDPKRVTIMGASAGGKAIGALMHRPDARRYFSQAILSSGAHQSVRSKETASRVARRFLNGRDAGELLSMPLSELRELQKTLCQGDGSTCLFGPVADGVILPEDSWECIHMERYWKGNAILGSCLHEMTDYASNPEFLSRAPKLCEELFGENASLATETFERYRGSRSDSDLWVKILSDYMYRCYSMKLADLLSEEGNRIWVYSMEESPAYHCMDQFYAFDLEERTELADAIREAYISFVISGIPQAQKLAVWESSTPQKKQMMVFKRENCGMKEYGEEECFHAFPQGVYQ